ncbi:MAG: large conductance mechanosensitive channel protein MscL [Clostridia bacterium]|nr:large conductance mechanosensitive channel protein MscL [Clostridia bacterium]
MSRLDKEALEEKIKAGEAAEKEEKIKKRKKEFKKKRDGFISDFKKFITKGNVLDLAVAVVIANSFNAIVNGLVKYIITPIMTYFTSGVSINEWKIVLREAGVNELGEEVAEIAIQHGLWLQAIIDFLIIAFSIFVAVRFIRSAEKTIYAKEFAKKEAEAKKKKAEEEEKAKLKAEEEERARAELREYYENIREQVELLKEIKNELNERNK